MSLNSTNTPIGHSIRRLAPSFAARVVKEGTKAAIDKMSDAARTIQDSWRVSRAWKVCTDDVDSKKSFGEIYARYKESVRELSEKLSRASIDPKTWLCFCCEGIDSFQDRDVELRSDESIRLPAIEKLCPGIFRDAEDVSKGHFVHTTCADQIPTEAGLKCPTCMSEIKDRPEKTILDSLYPGYHVTRSELREIAKNPEYLLEASKRVEVDSIRALLNANADPNARWGHFNLFPLNAACNSLHTVSTQIALNAVTLLIDAQADVNAKDQYGFTPLHLILDTKEFDPDLLEIMQSLLLAKADVNARDSDDETPLHYVCVNNHIDAMHLLLDESAEIDAKNKEGLTPLHMASKKQHAFIANSLLIRGANVNAQTSAGQTPLHLASEQESLFALTTFRTLLGAGADVTVRDKKGQTALDILRKAHEGTLPDNPVFHSMIEMLEKPQSPQRSAAEYSPRTREASPNLDWDDEDPRAGPAGPGRFSSIFPNFGRGTPDLDHADLRMRFFDLDDPDGG